MKLFKRISSLLTGGWILFWVIIPLGWILALSLGKRGIYGGWSLAPADLGLSNFARILDPLYLKVIGYSLAFAIANTLICFLLGMGAALYIARLKGMIKYLWIGLILLPFFTNLVVRAYGTRVLLDTGWASLCLGLIGVYLPLMIVPLFSALDRFDFTLVDAARDLGASPWRRITKIILPLNSKGVLSGCLLVFIPTLGEFVIPDLLGGAKVVLLGGMISDQFLKSRDWPFGAALSMVLVLALFWGIYFEKRVRS